MDKDVQRCARWEHRCGAGRQQFRNVGLRDGAADNDRDVARVGCPQRLDGAGRQRDVRAGQDRKPHQRNVFLQRDRHDVLDALADAGVDHLETGVAQRAGDDLGAAVMAVETGFGDKDSALESSHLEHHRLLELAPHRFERGDHFADGAVGVGAVDQLVHQVVIAFRGARQCGEGVLDGRGIPLRLDLGQSLQLKVAALGVQFVGGDFGWRLVGRRTC